MNLKPEKILVYSDLDGTLLDDAYRFSAVKGTISRLKRLDIPIIFCSSKTRGEILFYRRILNISDPFIVENGGAIYIPTGYFHASKPLGRHAEGYVNVEFGIPYAQVRQAFLRVRRLTGLKLIGFGDMNVKQLAKHSGLTLELARLAKEREYSEPFYMNDAAIDALQPFIAEEGLRCLQGDRYFHLTGGHDKGVAVKALSKLYTEEYSRVFTVGIGNARSDTAMIEAVDQPFQADLKTRVNVWKQLEAFVQRVLQHG